MPSSRPSIPKYVSVPPVMVKAPLPTPAAILKAPVDTVVPIVSEPPFTLISEDLNPTLEAAKRLVAVTVPLLTIKPPAVFCVVLAPASRSKVAAPKATVPVVLMAR